MAYAVGIPAKAGDRTPCTELKGDGETIDIGPQIINAHL